MIDANSNDKTWQTYVPRLVDIISVVAGLATLAMVGVTFIELSETATETILSIWAVAVITMLFLALGGVQYSTGLRLRCLRSELGRSARFADGASHLHRAHGHIRDAVEDLQSEDSGYMDQLRTALDDLAVFYSHVARVTCRASVKEIYIPDDRNEPAIKTVCRSRNSTASPNEDADLVKDNTDFHLLYNNPDRNWFFENDLSQRVPYANSHWDERTVAEGTYQYLATMVWPIRRKGTDDATGRSTHDLLGFLCVDTLIPGSFDEDTDFSPGASIAEALYSFLARREEHQTLSALIAAEPAQMPDE